jgi:hypothetical protein
MQEVAGNADVAALCESGWVTPEAVGSIAVMREKPASVVYGPLRDMPVEASKSAPTGSATCTNTIGTTRVACSSGPVVTLATAKMTSGARATSSAA